MFDPTIIFHRTQAGRDEIKQKSHGLTQSERLVLIMVDGASTFHQVRSKLPVLTDDRFNRAVQKLQAKELILEVFLPVEGQAPEELERTVIDRFLEQDPLDPVTIIMRDPDEELEFLARFSVPRPQAAQIEQTQSYDATSLRTAEESVPAPDLQIAPVAESHADEEIHTELIEQLSSELKQREHSRQQRSDKIRATENIPGSRERNSSSHKRSSTEPQRSQTSSNWEYWLIAIGIAFIAGYFLARIAA